MAKPKKNLFANKISPASEPEKRISDRTYFDEAEAKKREKQALIQETDVPVKTEVPKKVEKPVKMRTTVNLSEDDFYLMQDMIYTIRSSGQNDFVKDGDYLFNKGKFWSAAIREMKSKVEKSHGPIKPGPESAARERKRREAEG